VWLNWQQQFRLWCGAGMVLLHPVQKMAPGIASFRNLIGSDARFPKENIFQKKHRGANFHFVGWIADVSRCLSGNARCRDRLHREPDSKKAIPRNRLVKSYTMSSRSVNRSAYNTYKKYREVCKVLCDQSRGCQSREEKMRPEGIEPPIEWVETTCFIR